MVDRLDTARRSRLMQKVRTKDTGPELQVRKLLHGLGYRYRLHRKDLPGTPDIVFPSRRIAIFVHGCFWHAHGCRIGQPPKSRPDYWLAKLEANRLRDARNMAAMVSAGWHALIVWQCELKDSAGLIERLVSELGAPGSASLSRDLIPNKQALGKSQGTQLAG
jgi:DNA mismatch endonuclease (patch repair protein)